MFSSAGYFRSVNCPFFVHGLCHRPYCHFRHAKPGHGTTSKHTAVKSCLKPKATTTATKSGAEGSASTKSIKTPTKEESSANSCLDPKPSIQEQNNTIKKKANSLNNLKDEVVHDQSKEEPSSKEENKEKGAAQTTKKMSSILDSLNKIEQAVDEASASLMVQNNKKIINNSLKSSADSKSSSKTSSLVNTTKNEELTKEESDILDNKIKAQQEQVSKNLESKEKREDQNCSETSTESNKSRKCSETKQMSSLTKESEPINVDNDLDDKSVEENGQEMTKDSLDASREASATKRPKKDTAGIGKKRKSSESNDIEMKKAKMKKQKSQEDSVELKIKESSSGLKDKKNKEKEKINNDKKEKSEDHDKKNSNLKRPLKTKPELKIVDIDFFSSSKKSKSSKTEAKEKGKSQKEHSKEERKVQNSQSQLQTLRKNSASKHSKKPKLKSDSKDTKNSKKAKVHDDITQSLSVPMTTSLFESEDEVRFSSDSLSGSESDTDPVDSSTEMLREIFDNYDPDRDVPSTSSKRSKEGSSGSSRQSSSTSLSPAKDVQRKSSDLQGLGKKQRVAHNASYLVQRKSSNINPVRRVPKTIATSSSASSTQVQSSPKEINLVQGKTRIAHQPKPASQSTIPRPRIPIEYGAKVPQSFRQRYLDKIVDEYLRLCASETQAFDKAVEEEKNLYNRSTRRHMYLNLCINAIKNLRSQPTPEHEPESTQHQANTATATVSRRRSSETSPKKFDINKLTEEMFHDLLFPYLLTEDELVENGYPRSSPTTPGKVTFKSRKPQTTPSKDPNRRICCRCGTPYTVLADGTYLRPQECVYHVGRLLRRRTAGEVTTTYSCCGGDGSTPGCAVGKVHVSEGKNVTEGFMTTIVSPLAGNQKKVFAVDCEMCYTVAGLELTRATVVDWKLEKVYDTFVKPDNPVLDYNTRFSGVTEECLRGVKTSIREVQAVLLSMIHRDSILVGHSLESDLLALKLVHSKVVDTSVVFPHRLGPPYKRALRTLTAEFLKQIIQDDEAGHDSLEDAKASLELMLYKAKEDLKKKERNKR